MADWGARKGPTDEGYEWHRLPLEWRLKVHAFKTKQTLSDDVIKRDNSILGLVENEFEAMPNWQRIWQTARHYPDLQYRHGPITLAFNLRQMPLKLSAYEQGKWVQKHLRWSRTIQKMRWYEAIRRDRYNCRLEPRTPSNLEHLSQEEHPLQIVDHSLNHKPYTVRQKLTMVWFWSVEDFEIQNEWHRALKTPVVYDGCQRMCAYDHFHSRGHSVVGYLDIDENVKLQRSFFFSARVIVVLEILLEQGWPRDLAKVVVSFENEWA